MYHRLRQIAFVARELAPVEAQIRDVLGIEVCYRDPGVARFGLENALFPIGDQFLEVVAPIAEDTAGGRYLDRRGGDGGYMVITQADDHATHKARVERLRVRIVHGSERGSFVNMQLHPKDTGGTFFEIDQQLGPGGDDADGPWDPAGPDWQRARRLDRVTGITAAEIQCEFPENVAGQWCDIAGRPFARSNSGAPALLLDGAQVRFVRITDGRPEGLSALDVRAVDALAVIRAARAHGLPVEENTVTLCGVRINLV